MKVLEEGDRKVRMLVGRAKAQITRCRLSTFVMKYGCRDGSLVLYHFLTKRMIQLDPEERAVLETSLKREGRGAEAAGEAAASGTEGAEEGTAGELIAEHFLVPEETDEAKTYLEVLDALDLVFPLRKGIYKYTILPTSGCNARCAYCFEERKHPVTMNAETARHVVDFIDRTKPDSELCLEWFGGEPLLGAKYMDQICAGLSERGIRFYSFVKTNAYFMDEELLVGKKERWNIRHVQVTLDGTENIYNQRKNYIKPVASPFRRVIGNIHAMQSYGVRPLIRLNIDRNNAEDMAELIDFLDREFPDKEYITINPVVLFQELRGPESVEMGKKVLELAQKCIDCGFSVPYYQKMPVTLDRIHCTAACPQHRVVIDPAGNIQYCDQRVETDPPFGNVRDGITEKERWRKQARRRPVSGMCKSCMMLPVCSSFHECPIVVRDCRDFYRDKMHFVMSQDLRNRGIL